MRNEELLKVSPVRLLEEVAGNNFSEAGMYLVSSKKGLGKTSVLVQMALDELFSGKSVVHVSFEYSSNVIAWYDSLLSEIAKRKNLSLSDEEKKNAVKQRIIFNANQETFTLSKAISFVSALREGGWDVGSVVVDGGEVEKITAEEFESADKFAKENGIKFWFSKTACGCGCGCKENGEFKAIIHLEGTREAVAVKLLSNDKKELGELKLDSKTMLFKK